MVINPADAIKAFNQAASLGGDGMEARDKPKSTFLDMIGKMAEDTIHTGKKAEALSEKAVVGKADLMDVVQAVSNAQLTLETVVAVRDRVVNAYQEIMRMPI
jgi:flagellar hook-basal body complex protein FliE